MKPELAGKFALDDHKFLATGGPVRELFDEFHDRCLALGRDVVMQPLKYYIAFKAATNFVDVIPQAKRLQLTINMEYAELDDPQGTAEDVTGLGLWGNGDIRVSLESVDQLDYVMTLVRQSYEKQLVAT
jgi:predicted transport protein